MFSDQRERHRRNPLRAEPRHEGLRASVESGSREGSEHGDGPCNEKRENDHTHRCPTVAEEVSEGEERAEHDEDREFDYLDHVLCACPEALANIRTQDSERDRAHEDCNEPVASRQQHSDAVRGKCRPQRVKALLMRGYLASQPHLARHQKRGHETDGQAYRQSERDVLEDEFPPHEVTCVRVERSKEGKHGRQREAVVHAGLEVERVPYQPGDPGIRDHARGQHGVRRREQRAEQKRLRPREIGHRRRGASYERAGQGHSKRELPEGKMPRPLEHLRLDFQTVSKQDQDQRDDRERLDEPRAGIEVQHLEASLAEYEPCHHEDRREREEAAPRQPGDQSTQHQEHPEDRYRLLERSGGRRSEAEDEGCRVEGSHGHLCRFRGQSADQASRHT